MDYKDYYSTLGIKRDATEKEIKQAYRKLARKFHPDVNPDKKAEERFKEINEAHEVLTDPAKRKKYDQFGADWQRHQQAGGQSGGFNWADYASGPGRGARGGRVEYVDLNDLFSQGGGTATGSSGGFSDFFEALFGRGGIDGGARDSQPRRAPDQEQAVDVTLEEAFAGSVRTLQSQTDGRRVEVKIPPGVKTGSRIRVPGETVTGPHGGDLYLRINVVPHRAFERDGDDLRTEVPLDMYTAALGGEINVPTLSGKMLSLHIPPETQNGRVFRLQGQGMPRLRRPTERGDLFVKLKLMLPSPLTEREKAALGELAQLRKQ